MEVREDLQTGMPAKRTSRRPAVVVAVSVVVVAVFLAAEKYWISPGERTAGRLALANIDSLQNWSEMSDAQFDAGDQQARQTMSVAKARARTFRDKNLANGLGLYLESTEDDRSTGTFLARPDQLQQEDTEQKSIEAQRRQDSVKLRASLRDVLHRELD